MTLNISRITSMLMMSCAVLTVLAASETRSDITVDDLLTIRDITNMVVSPDGKYVAYRVVRADKDSNDYDIGWYVAATESNAKPLLVADGGEAALGISFSGRAHGGIEQGEIVWSADSEWIYFTKRQQGAAQLWRSHRSRYGQEQLTDNAGDVEGLNASKERADVFFAVGRTRADIAEVDERNSRLGYLAQETANYAVDGGPRWPPCVDGQKRWYEETKKERHCLLTVWVFDSTAGVERKATDDEISAYYAKDDISQRANGRYGMLKDQSKRLIASSAGGRRLAWFENEDPAVFMGMNPPMRVAASDGEENFRCPAEVCQAKQPQGIWWSADNSEVVFLVNNGWSRSLASLYGWASGDEGVRTILSSDDMFFDCDIAGTRLICGHETWSSPRRIVSVALEDGSITTIANMNPDFEGFSFTKIEKILGEDAYGNKAHAHLVYPKDYREGKRYPLVIVQYTSRGFLRGGVGDEHPIHVLAQQGLAVLSSHDPTTNFFAETANQLEAQINFEKYLIIGRGPATAIEGMVDRLDKRGIIDPKRVGITGLSTGASTVDLLLLSRNYAAASSAYSNSAPPNFLFLPSSFEGKVFDGVAGGTPFSKEGFATRAKHSVGMQASRIDTPYLIQVADREYHHTVQNYHALKGAGKPVEMVIYPDEYHVKWQPAHRYNVYRRNVQWFKFWLQDEEVDDPVDPEQYVRWRKLREMHQENLTNVGKNDVDTVMTLQ